MKRKILCVSVRLRSLVKISAKAYIATDFNGNEDFIPISQVFGEDLEVHKSDAYWIAEWCLRKKNITYDKKKIAWFNEQKKRIERRTEILIHQPDYIKPVESNEIDELRTDRG